MVFSELVIKRLDYIKLHKSEKYYIDTIYYAKRWVEKWGNMLCSQIQQDMIENFIRERSKVSNYCSNMEIRLLRALFNFGVKRKYISNNPCNGIDFLPIEKRLKYIPPKEDIDKVIDIADPETQDYLWTIRETFARVNEVNNLKWDDVSLGMNAEDSHVILYTRKKKGGDLTPRMVPMTDKLYDILIRRYDNRDESIQWVFYHRYFSKKENCFVVGKYQYRKRLMKTLCEKAGVRHFGFHTLRHSGASTMDYINVPIGSIQRLLGHENRTTTEHYLHSIGNGEREAMKAYEDFRKNSLANSLANLKTENVFH